MIDSSKVEEIARNFLESSEMFVVSTMVLPGNKIKILIDGDKGVKIDDCAKLSRHIESHIDRDQEDFEIEVSSAGVGLPLQLKRQYLKNKGRTLTVTGNDGSKITGKLLEINDESILIEKEAKKAKKKPNADEEKTVLISFDQISEARIEVSFK